MSAISKNQGYQRASNLPTESLLALPALFNEHGINLLVDNTVTPIEEEGVSQEVVDDVSGSDTRSALSLLASSTQNLRTLAFKINATIFCHGVTSFLPQTRPVAAALDRVSSYSEHSANSLFSIIIKFYHKDSKHPIRNIPLIETSLSFNGENTFPGETIRDSVRTTTAGIFEDTPLSRRYIRYLSFLANRVGLNLCMYPWNHADSPLVGFRNLSIRNGVLSSTEGSQGRHTGLAVFFFGNYTRFRSISIYETRGQPNQQPRSSGDMCYTPIINDNLPSIVAALSTLGGFSPCKTYYKDSRRQQNSQPVAPLSSTSSTNDSNPVPF